MLKSVWQRCTIKKEDVTFYKENESILYSNNFVDERNRRSASCINHGNFTVPIYAGIRAVNPPIGAFDRETNNPHGIAREAPCFARLHRLHLPSIPKRRKEPRVLQIWEFHAATRHIVPHLYVFAMFLAGFPRRRWTGSFFFAGGSSCNILPKPQELGGAKAGPNSAAGDAGATCGYGGRRLLPILSTVARVRLGLAFLSPSPASSASLPHRTWLDRLSQKRSRFVVKIK